MAILAKMVNELPNTKQATLRRLTVYAGEIATQFCHILTRLWPSITVLTKFKQTHLNLAALLGARPTK